MEILIGYQGNNFVNNRVSVSVSKRTGNFITHRIVYEYDSYSTDMNLELYLRLIRYKSIKHFRRIVGIFPIGYYEHKIT
jgi:hypothetical protein